MNSSNLKKVTYTINTIIIFIVLGMMFFFSTCPAPFLVYFSIPTLIVYLIGYVLIHKEKLYFYVWMVYIWITLYMFLTTICLGYNYGFHLYSLSMIPIIYYTNYMGYKINTKTINAGVFSVVILLAYLGCTFYVTSFGPVYQGSELSAALFWIVNSIIVFFFLIYYTRLLIKNIITSEDKLREMSYVDRLTGLYNRHYMMEMLEKVMTASETDTVAMIDIDDFKKINDTYGHNAGDCVLKKLSDIMRTLCPDVVISRWGGEEFLLLIGETSGAKDKMEQLRRMVEKEDFTFEGKKIRVTITIGLASKESSQSLDQWIQSADNRLYAGKNNGKNAVIGF